MRKLAFFGAMVVLAAMTISATAVPYEFDLRGHRISFETDVNIILDNVSEETLGTISEASAKLIGPNVIIEGKDMGSTAVITIINYSRSNFGFDFRDSLSQTLGPGDKKQIDRVEIAAGKGFAGSNMYKVGNSSMRIDAACVNLRNSSSEALIFCVYDNKELAEDLMNIKVS